MDNKEIVKTGFEKYIEEFDEKYRQHHYEKQIIIPKLLKLYEEFEDNIYVPTNLDKDIHKLQVEIINKLEEQCNEEQKELVNQLRYCIGAETSEFIEQGFIFGYCIGQSLKEESESFINKKSKYCNIYSNIVK